jgi:oligoribonuclease (3'-5' exoribonuclease)
MIYYSIDIETTGLDSENHKILSIGAIMEDTNNILPYEKCPKFNAIIIPEKIGLITGGITGLLMNMSILKQIDEYTKLDFLGKKDYQNESGFSFFHENEISKRFYEFIAKTCPLSDIKQKHIVINVAGKNFGVFDKLFLEKLPDFKKYIKFRQRIIDPSTLYCDFINDTSLPNLTKCKERANIDGIVTHNALEDAWDVIELLRKKY